mmetsp:Transcript_13158/g.25187  ORF Transcript_13158/g.25187 Transcript_13158/m.25187 type:complete len:461 (-) Transcript_13158:315-1697(-)
MVPAYAWVASSVVALTIAGMLGWLPRWMSLKGLVLALVSGYKASHRLLLRMQGLSTDDVAYRRVVTGQAWEEFCDTLKAAGSAVIGHGSPKDPLTQAEGYRYLSRLTRVALENFIECSDPMRPSLVALANGSRLCRVCIGSDNPDNLYQNATIDPTCTYRVTGTRGTVHYLGFGVQSGAYGSPGGLRTVDYRQVHDEAFETKEDGTLELYIVPKGQPKPESVPTGNVLRSEPSIPQGLFIVRQTFARRFEEKPAELKITRVDGRRAAGDQDVAGAELKGNIQSDGTYRNITPAQLDKGLAQAGLLVAGASNLFARWAWGFRKHVNTLPLFDQKTSDNAGGDPNIRYYHSYWQLGEDEALVIDAKPPPCFTWNFQLNNHWMESLDYRHHKIHTNKFLAKYRNDGSVRVVVSHRDPGLNDVNWLTTTGHSSGTMCWRWVKPEVSDEKLPHPVAKVVPIDQLR